MKRGIVLFLILLMSGMLVGCIPPAQVEKTVDINTNETAYLVPLEGATKDGQAKFMSLEYLEEAKVATKRVTLPQRKKKTGRFYWHFEWIPTMRVIKVDRTPVTREWTSDAKTGTSTSDQAIWVESKDSIGFAVGVNITALVSEADATKFLYYYAGKPLTEVIDENVRGFVTSVLSREFGSRDLTMCKSDKKDISTLVLTEASEQFKDMGITITNLGLVGGLTYEDKEIQKAINEAYTAEMSILKAQHQREAQIHINQKKVEIATADRQAAEEFAKAQEAMIAKVRLEIEMIKAEATKIAAEKWNGNTPTSILPEGSSMLFGLDKVNK